MHGKGRFGVSRPFLSTLLNAGTNSAVSMEMAVAVVDREGTETVRPSQVPEAGASTTARWDDVTHRRVRWVFALAAVLVVALVVSLIVRPIGSNVTAVDGWGVDAFEFSIGVLCLARYFEGSWRSSSPTARLFPLVMGVACLSWALGDIALTTESLGGANPPIPSVADGFYVGFFIVCFLGFALLIRRGNKSSLVSTSLDGLIAGLGVAAVSAAFVVADVIKITGGGALAAATNLAYPLGDVLLLALAIGGLLVLPRGFRLFFALASVALVANALGDTFNLLQPMSRFGYISNGAAWPISLSLIALAVWILPADIEMPGTDRIAGFALPAFGAGVGMAILFLASLGHLGRPAIALATVTLLVAGVRLALTVREAHAVKTARFRSLIDKTWDLIAVIEADLRIAYITPSSERVLGYRPGELEGRAFTEIVHPDDAPAVLSHLVQLNDNEGSVLELRMRHANGNYRTIDWNAADLLDDPSVHGYVLNGGDVTEARQAAEDLVAARDAALVASRTKSQFVSTMSHEIRTPMNGVIGLTELLLQTNLDNEQAELASGVKVSAESLLVIINDILDFSKIEAGKMDIEESQLDLAGVIDDVGRILAGTAHGKGIELLVDVQPDVPAALLGDATRIRQVLLNFGANAVKFTSAGEVVIRVKVLHQNSERVALHFDVADTGDRHRRRGPGEAVQRFCPGGLLDDAPLRWHGARPDHQPAAGGAHGGKLGLTSAPGEGSTFWFELSLRRAEDAPALDSTARIRGPSRANVRWSWTTTRPTAESSASSFFVGRGGGRSGRRIQALELALTAAAGRTSVRPRCRRPEHARHGRHRAGTGLEDRPVHRGDDALLAELVGPPARTGRVPLTGFAASLTKPVRSSELFDCLITSLNSGSASEDPCEADAGTSCQRRRSWARSCWSRTTR